MYGINIIMILSRAIAYPAKNYWDACGIAFDCCPELIWC